MFFSYACQKCNKRFDRQFPVGKAPRETVCDCGGKGKRVYEGMSIMLRTNGVHGGINRGSSFGEQMKAKNVRAAERQKSKTPPVRLAGYKYADGSIREAH